MKNHIRGSTVGFRGNRIFGKWMRESSAGDKNDFCENGLHGSLGPYWDLDLGPWALLRPGPWALLGPGPWALLGPGPWASCPIGTLGPSGEYPMDPELLLGGEGCPPHLLFMRGSAPQTPHIL